MPSISLLLGIGAATLSSVASATKYTVQDTYAGSSFFDNFNFATEEKTNGFVKYVDRSRAESKGYISYKDGDAVFGVDYKSTLDSSPGKDIGRESVRLEGMKEYNKGLFVLDVKHMPGGICGTWPAFWSLGREPWPVKGEIDIIEGVNKNSVNKFVLHTDTSCKTDGKGQTGIQALYDCAFDGPSGASGCDVNDVSTKTYGAGFNANDGGHYVTELQAEGIKMWFFPRGSAPKSLMTGEPDTSEFGTPNANFKGDCDIEKRFLDQRFIFTNTFCGDWAGNAYAGSGCPMYQGLSSMESCKKYVAENPTVFKDAYWRVGSFKTYNKRTISSSSSVTPSSTPHPSSSSSVRVSSSSAHVSSSATYSSSSSVYVSSSVAHSSSAYSSSVVHPSVTPTTRLPSSVYEPLSTPVVSSSYAYNVSSSVLHSSSSFYSASASETSYDHASSSSLVSESSSTYSPSASETSYDHTSSIYSASVSETPHPTDSSSSCSSTSSYHTVSSGVTGVLPSETPYGSSSTAYPSGASSSVNYHDVTSYPTYESSTSISSPVYPDSASAHAYSVYPIASSKYPDASSNLVPTYGDYPVSTPSAKSTPVYADYPELPSLTPLYSTYPAFSSKHSYETTYVDICSTGYTTVTTRVTATQTPAPYQTTDAYYAPPGFEITTKYCAQGCGEGPMTVTVTVPCSKCQVSTPLSHQTTSKTPGVPSESSSSTIYTPAQPSKPSNPEDSTVKITATKIVTLTKVPASESQYYATHPSIASASTSLINYPDSDGKNYGNDKPVVPTGHAGGNEPVYPTLSVPASPTGPSDVVKPVYSTVVGYLSSNVTLSYATASSVKHKPTQTEYKVPEFTGAASGVRVGGVIAGAVAVFAAMMM